MRSLSVILLLFAFSPVFAQYELVKKNIEVGMFVRIKKCKPGKKSFETMDLYTKTRYPETGIKIDTLSGEGVFENFFAPGDFDARRLPASYGNKKYKIAALRIFDEKDGKEKRVMICYTGNKRSMIWIEVDKAVAQKEIEF
jgi:hypothetical protein